MLSNKSTMVKVKMMLMRPCDNALFKSICINVPATSGKLVETQLPEGSCVTPQATPKIVVTMIPKSIAARNFKIMSVLVKKNPNINKSTSGLDTLPKVTNVLGSFTTIPPFFNPMRAMKEPIPTTIASFKSIGTEFTMY